MTPDYVVPIEAAAPETVDIARVAELRAAIAAGDYVVDPEAIAEQLVERGFPGDVNPS